MLVRDATDADWPAMWRFMQPLIAAGETFPYDRDLTEADTKALWFQEPPGSTLVADDAGRPLGTATLHRNHGGGAAHVAGASFMVDPAAWGEGVGRFLGEMVLARARQAGFRVLQFNAVVETNERAVALWRALGFEVTGTIPAGFEHPEHGFVALHVMHRAL